MGGAIEGAVGGTLGGAVGGAVGGAMAGALRGTMGGAMSGALGKLLSGDCRRSHGGAEGGARGRFNYSRGLTRTDQLLSPSWKDKRPFQLPVFLLAPTDLTLPRHGTGTHLDVTRYNNAHYCSMA